MSEAAPDPAASEAGASEGATEGPAAPSAEVQASGGEGASSAAAPSERASQEVAASEAVASEAARGGGPTSEAATSEAATSEAATSQAATGEAASSEAASSEAAPSKTASSEAATSEAASSETATSEAASSETATSEAVSSETATSEAASSEAATSEAASSEAATSEAASSETATSEAASSEAAPGEAASDEPRSAAAASELAGAAALEPGPEWTPEPTPTGTLQPEPVGRDRPLEAASAWGEHEAVFGPGSAPSGAPPPEPTPPGQPPRPLKLPPRRYPRLVAFLAVLISIAAFLMLGGYRPGAGHVLVDLSLSPEIWEQPAQLGWRLVTATFAGTGLWVGLCSWILLWGGLGAFEERGGSSGALLLTVAGGAVLNGVRLACEPQQLLLPLSGGWALGIAGGAAGAVLARRRGEPAGGPIRTVIFQTVLLLGFVTFSGLWDPALLQVLGVAIALGSAWGAIWPSGAREVAHLGAAPRDAPLARAAATLVALALIGLALGLHRARPPQPFRPRTVPALSTRVHPEPLGVLLDLPGGWSEAPQPKEVDCGTCGATARWDPARVNDPIPGPKTCAQCGGEVLHGNRRMAVYVDGGSGLLGFGQPSYLVVFAQERGAFDDADTVLEQILSHQFRTADSPLREAPIEREASFAAEGFPRGYLMVLRGSNERVALFGFVDRKRTVVLVFRGPLPSDPESGLYLEELQEAIARTLRPAPPPAPGAGPTPTPTPTPTPPGGR